MTWVGIGGAIFERAPERAVAVELRAPLLVVVVYGPGDEAAPVAEADPGRACVGRLGGVPCELSERAGRI